MRFKIAFIACSFALLIAAPAASRVAPPDSIGLRMRDPADSERARMLGMLTYTRLSLTFDDVPVRDAFVAIAQSLEINIVGRWSDDKVGHGLDPDSRVTIHAESKAAIDVIEELLEQCETYEDCTWQLRAGIVEVGTKRRLAVSAARERRTYDLTDLLLEAPYFPSNGAASAYARVNSVYVDAVLGEANRHALREGLPPPRKTKSDVMLELAEGLVETIEPGHWNLAGRREEAAADDGDDDDSTATPSGKLATGGAQRRNDKEWARLRFFQEALVITAPDFMHRQIGGYPRPTRPADADVVRIVPSPGRANSE